MENNFLDGMDQLKEEITEEYGWEEAEESVEEVLETDLIPEYLEDSMEELLMEDDQPIPSYIEELNTYTKGYSLEEPHMVLAPSGTGKSTYMICESVQMVQNNYNVLVISQEMSRKVIRNRMLTCIANTSTDYWEMHRHDEHTKEKRLEKANEYFNKYIKRRMGFVFKELKLSELLKIIAYAKGKYNVIFVDYYQRIECDMGGGDEKEKLQTISKEVTRALKDTGLTLIWLGQVTDTETKKDKKFSRVKGSRQINHDCANIFFMYKEEENEHQMNLFIQKARHGTGFKDVELAFDGARQRIGTFELSEQDELNDLWDEWMEEVR